MASSKRERELARMRAERQAARRAAEAADRLKRRNALLAGLSALAVAAVIVVIALVTDDGKPSTLAQPSASPSATTPSGGCTYTPGAPAAKKVTGLPASTPTTTSGVKVVMTTNRGEIDLTLNGAKAPCTTNSFAFLAGQKYFDGTSCPRVVTSGIFVLQCGDPKGDGTGGPGYQFADENLAALGAPDANGSVIYPAGTLAMANGGPGTNGSQFFLVYKDSPLGPNYTPFGTITKGLDVILGVAAGGDDGSNPAGGGHPKLPITLTKVTIA